MNSNYELYGACRHKTTFHRFTRSTACEICTDEGVSPEKVNNTTNSYVGINPLRCQPLSEPSPNGWNISNGFLPTSAILCV